MTTHSTPPPHPGQQHSPQATFTTPADRRGAHNRPAASALLSKPPAAASAPATMEGEAQSAVIQQFCDITGVDDVGTAISVLEATNWQLEEAINLQFATGGVGGGGGGGGLGGDGGGADGGLGDLPMLDEEEDVRAPMPVVRDRLYGDRGGPHGIAPGMRPARYSMPPSAADRGPTHIDVFQDHEAPSSSSGGGAAAAGASHRLSDLFKPPAGLLFEGDFESAKAHAAKQGRWLLVNVQAAEEFDAHRLNRDTWSQALVQDMMRESFVFWQAYNTSQQGGGLVMSYQVQRLPSCLIIDPITGAKLWEREGFISADDLIEEMVPFMDAGPNDPAASALAQRFFTQAAKRRNKGSGSGTGGAAAAAGGGGMTEDDQLALALAMSVEGGGAAAAAAGGAGAESDELDEEAMWRLVREKEEAEAAAAKAAAAAAGSSGQGDGGSSEAVAAQQATPPPAEAAAEEEAASPPAPAVDVAAVQAAAAARLPPEPAAGAAGSCRVAFRLPNGNRVQRTFSTSDTVAALQDYVVSLSSDAAALPRFTLSEARPGSAPLADPAATIEQAGVANAMLVLRS